MDTNKLAISRGTKSWNALEKIKVFGGLENEAEALSNSIGLGLLLYAESFKGAKVSIIGSDGKARDVIFPPKEKS